MTAEAKPHIEVGRAAPVRPHLARQDNVSETLHGVEIVDPYRWLEDQDSPETRMWIEEQDAYTRALLSRSPGREQIAKRLNELARIDSIGIPTVRQNTYFFSRRGADQELPVLYRRVGLDGADEVLIDPHNLSDDHSVTVSMQDISDDGSLLVYGIRQGGEDELEIRFMDVESKTDRADKLPRARFMSTALTQDKQNLYYSLETDEGPRAYRHTLGMDMAADVEIFGTGYDKGKYLTVHISEDGRYLLFNVFYGSAASKTDLYIQALTPAPLPKKPGRGEAGDLVDEVEQLQHIELKPADTLPIVPLITTIDARFYGDVGGNHLYLQTNWNAPNERMLVLDLTQVDLTQATDAPIAPELLKELVPTSPTAVLEGFSLAGGHIVLNYLQDVTSRIEIFDAAGKYVRDITLPTLGSASGLYGRWDSPETFYTFTSFALPAVVTRYDMNTGITSEWARMNVPINPDDFEVRQVFYASKDGTRIPMFLLHKKGLEWDGARPTLLYGYGGFTASMTPYFSSFATVWAEQGGVYAVANLRGGGEYGEDWHQAGMLANKQNTFDDFIAAGEWLIAQNITNPDKLAIMGGSNGGLLVGAALTQRPELFRAVICAVPLLDMVRYHQFLVARYWVPEYGSSEDPEQFKTLMAYSPYHQVKPGAKYPATLFVTGDADTRVAPLHARKMAALLQAQTGSDRPILLHYDTKSGHMGTRPMGKVIEDLTDELCFLFEQLGVTAA